jgi:C1A family cysteine protease
MMLVLLLTTAFAYHSELQAHAKFQTFQKKFEKVYEGKEEERRFGIFKDNLEIIEEHNAKNLSWTMGVTQFADMTAFEFTAFVKRGNGGGFVPKLNEQRNVASFGPATCDSVDWVAKGAVTPVKNQGQCGSCWSFSTTGAIEGRSVISNGQVTGTPIPLSEQDLVDCDSTDSGCNGGLMDYAFEFVKTNGGLCSEAEYAYTARQARQCQEDGCTKYGQITGYQDVTQKSTSDLEAAVCEGPVSIAIEADQSSFQLYNGGVLTSKCGSNLDHGVLLVGMGTDGADKYWKVKNSWGASWGEQGYIRLCRDCDANCGFLGRCSGQCGLLQSASFPTV